MAVLVEQQLGLGTQLGHQLGVDVGVQGGDLAVQAARLGRLRREVA